MAALARIAPRQYKNPGATHARDAFQDVGNLGRRNFCYRGVVTFRSTQFRPWLALIGASVALAGCSFASEGLWPSLSGDEPRRPPSQAQAAQAQQQQQAQRVQQPPGVPARPAAAMPPPSGQPQPMVLGAAPPVQAGQPTGTFVGTQVAGLRGELVQLQGRLNERGQRFAQVRASTTQNAQVYHGIVAAIGARLQMGTTPGNPVLTQQWNEAQGQLDRLSSDIAGMNALGNEVSADASLANFLLDRARGTYSLSGAVDDDHRQLQVLEDEISRTQVSLERLLSELTGDIQRQTSYIGAERANLTALSYGVKSGQAFGGALSNRLGAVSPADLAGGRPVQLAGRRPLVVIRFDRPDVPYQQALYNAVSKAIEARPQAQFDLVSVTPQRGGAADASLAQQRARRSAENVMRSLGDMGLPANRVTMSSTTSAEAATNEVHLYVR